MNINSTSGGKRLLDAGSRKWVGYNQLLTGYKQRMSGLVCHVALWEDTIDKQFFRPIYGNYKQFYFNSCVKRVPLASAKPKQAQLTHLSIFNPFFSQKWKKSNKECHHLLAICTEYDLHTVQPDPIYYMWRGRMFIYVCVSKWGQLSNKEGEKKQQHCSVSLGSVGQRSSLVFTVKHSVPGLREDDQRFSAAPRRPASRSADISLFFPPSPLFPQQQHRYVARRGDRVAGNVDERGADRKFGFRLSALFRKLCYVMLERLDGNREKGGRGWGHTAQLDWKLSKKQILFNGTPPHQQLSSKMQF